MIEYIRNNPYRILGVFSNDKEDILNENSIWFLTWSKNKKVIELSTDYSHILGQPDRSIQSLKNATYSLEKADIKEVEKLFWFHKDNEKYGEYINESLKALIKGDFYTSLVCYKNAFEEIRPSSRILEIFFERAMKHIIRINPTENVFQFMYNIFGEDYRMEFQEAIRRNVRIITTPKDINQNNEESISIDSSHKEKRIRRNYRLKSMFKEYFVKPWCQYNNWTKVTICLLFINIVMLFIIL